MLKEGKFGYHEAISLIVITIVLRVFFTSPAIIVQLVGTTGWYMTIISALTAAFLFIFVYLLLKRFPGKNIMEINQIVLGKWLGSVISLVLSAFLIFSASMNMREFSEILKVFVLPESPPSFVMIIFALSVATLSFMGLEIIARYAKFVIYVLGAGFLTIIFLSYSDFNSFYLYPLLGYGLDKTILNGLLRCSFYGEVALVGVIAKSLYGPKEIKRIGFSTLLISGIITSISLLTFSLVFPYTTAQELVSPMYSMATIINLGSFLQRMEPIFLFLWNFGSFIEVAFLYYTALMIYCHVFKITDKRPIILPLTILMYCVNLIPKGLSEIETQTVQFLRSWGWIFYFIPSIIVLLIAVISKKKGDQYDI